MNADKIERPIALVERRNIRKQDDTSRKTRVKENLKRKLLNSHCYKKMFVRRKKMKDVNEIIAKGSFSGSSFEKQRLCYAQGSGESSHQFPTENVIESGSGELTEKDDHVLPYVNKLREFWNKGQNAVVFDGQERLVKVVRFVSSLLDNIKNPVLILASSSALSLWESEFSKCSKSMNLVTYKGRSKVKRAAIRDTELYSENGCMKFQVLLSSPYTFDQDMEMFDNIKWGLLVIDECQRPMFSIHFRKFKMPMADMKLVTVSGEIVDKCLTYRYILSLIDCNYETTNTFARMEMNDKFNTLKEKLSPFIAFECKFDNTGNIEEYWVPVHLSSLQIEKYCMILASNLKALSSSSMKSPLRDIITHLQKCCDHPYLVEPALRDSSEKASSTDPLDVEINVSGKMQVFNKLLSEIKRYGLRVLVLFQSEGTEKISIASMLDDFVKNRFGESSYVHIPKKIINESLRAKKKELVEMFNHAESERFICLCDYNACWSSITLSRVDVVILFNSDVNPLNDIKCLKRMNFDTPCVRLKVFRLYSAFTNEEKALILSKQGSTVNFFTVHSYRRMLAWGAYDLFSKVQTCTDSGPLFFIDDLVHELISLLKNKSVEMGPTNRSMISKAHMQNGVYSGSILLFGENESHAKGSSIDKNFIDKKPSVFWKNLVKQSQYSRLEDEIRKYATTSSDAISERRRKRKAREKNIQKLKETSGLFSSQQSCENVTEECTQRDVPLPISSPSPFEAEMERIQKEREQITILHKEEKSMIVSECEKEIAETKKKYDALIHDSEMSMTRDIKILEDYQKLVDVHKLLAEILSQDSQDGFELNPSEHTLNPSELDLHRPESRRRRKQKESSLFNISDIPASALVPPKSLCSTTYLSAPSLAIPGLRAPAPHLRTNSFPTLHAPAIHLQPNQAIQLLLEPPPIMSPSQTLPGLQTESNNGL